MSSPKTPTSFPPSFQQVVAIVVMAVHTHRPSNRTCNLSTTDASHPGVLPVQDPVLPCPACAAELPCISANSSHSHRSRIIQSTEKPVSLSPHRFSWRCEINCLEHTSSSDSLDFTIALKTEAIRRPTLVTSTVLRRNRILKC